MSHPPVASEPMFDTVAVVGVGLIGGSLAAAIKARGIARKVIGVGRSAQRLEAARNSGLVDEIAVDAIAAAAKSNLLIFCTPVDRIVAGVREAAAGCRPGTLITDAGSVKGEICRNLVEGLPQGVEFVGSHPLAGSEKQGFEHADSSLFENKVCVVTPVPENNRSAVERLWNFWQALGMRVREMPPHSHDRVLAETSHLPHVAAAALAATLVDEDRPFAASGFRDTTRIASGDPELWTAILLQNAEEVVNRIDHFGKSLDAFREAIHHRNASELRSLLSKARSNRDSLNGNGT